MTDQRFGARYDRLTKLVSGGFVALLVALPVLARETGWVSVFGSLVSLSVLGLSYGFSPRGYEISGDAFRVKRLIRDVVIPMDRLRFLRDATEADLSGSVRLFGSGGAFGYYGWFWSRALGRSRWYVTDRERVLVLADGDEIVLVSPEDHDGFVAAIRRVDEDMGEAAARPTDRRMLSAMAWGLGVGGLVLALTAGAMRYAPGCPPVDLTRDSLVIHSRFYGMTVPASGVDVANVRVVDLQAERGWRPVLRTGGFGNPYYRAGNFRTASGRAVRLYTTGATRLVLLPPLQAEGTPVLLEAAEPEKFTARVREEWGRR